MLGSVSLLNLVRKLKQFQGNSQHTLQGLLILRNLCLSTPVKVNVSSSIILEISDTCDAAHSILNNCCTTIYSQQELVLYKE